ncbi:MAG TPA: (2Fe-2S)-binding protein [Pseudonocardiaceae bacterium]|nr:(2Fe-2S)-binding protein [Pseudonocardiaceae bacterium]
MPHAAVPHKEPAGAVAQSRAHPLAHSIAVVDRAVTLLGFSMLDDHPLPEPRGLEGHRPPWIECADALSDAGFFARWRVAVARRLADQHALPPAVTIPEKTASGYIMQWYLIIPSYLGALLFHSARRVPALAARRLAFRLDSATLLEVALRPGRFWCLPDDPDARHPDAVPVPDEAALAAVLRHEVITHAAHFLTVYDPQVRFGHRTRWATVTDVLDSGFLLAGRSFGSPQAGASDARLVLGEGAKPLTSASTICTVTDERGRTHWTRRRGSCCFLYALPGIERPCASCPRVCEADRARIFSTLDPT